MMPKLLRLSTLVLLCQVIYPGDKGIGYMLAYYGSNEHKMPFRYPSGGHLKIHTRKMKK
jgi:hypothetical protein